ncbi:V-type ATPase 116kDa subunit family protein [Streptomyces sp. NPDC001070]
MQRVAVVAPYENLRETLIRVAESGCVQIDLIDDPAHIRPGPAAHRLGALRGARMAPVLSESPPDLDTLERDHRVDLLSGERELEERMDSAVRRAQVAALAGWCPRDRMAAAADHVAGAGGSLVALPPPPGSEPPTLLRAAGSVRGSFAPVIRVYGTVPYTNLDLTVPAGLVYVAMFGVMFGDVGYGGLLILAALLLRWGRPGPLARWCHLWPFVAAAGTAGILAGAAYGELFGPTGVLPVLWLDPLQEPMRLLRFALGLGVVLLVLSYAAGAVNRWREGGGTTALYALSGLAGAVLFAGLVSVGAGLVLGRTSWWASGGAVAAAGLVLAGTGLYTLTPGGAPGVLQAGIQLVDGVIRIGANVFSFARLAAFGLTHAALAAIVWQGTRTLAAHGTPGILAAVVLFVVGTAVTFALEALVAGVQALRLEFYELFSRVFEGEGRPFEPWHPPVQRKETAP